MKREDVQGEDVQGEEERKRTPGQGVGGATCQSEMSFRRAPPKGSTQSISICQSTRVPENLQFLPEVRRGAMGEGLAEHRGAHVGDLTTVEGEGEECGRGVLQCLGDDGGGGVGHAAAREV